MSWWYADSGRQVGPVEDTALDDLFRAGVVRDDTLVWRDGMANWQPHSIARGVRMAPAPMPIPATPMAAETGFCSECGRPFPMNQLVAIGNASVCAQCKPMYLQRVREGGQAIIGARRYAGFWIRFVARVIDSVILAVVIGVLMVPLSLLFGLGALNIPSSTDPAAALGAMMGALSLYILLGFGVNLAYEVYFDSTRGGTPGKLILGLKIIRNDGSLMSAGQATGRYFGYILSGIIFYIGFIMAGFDEEKRALHDRIVDTRVIYSK